MPVELNLIVSSKHAGFALEFGIQSQQVLASHLLQLRPEVLGVDFHAGEIYVVLLLEVVFNVAILVHQLFLAEVALVDRIHFFTTENGIFESFRVDFLHGHAPLSDAQSLLERAVIGEHAHSARAAVHARSVLSGFSRAAAAGAVLLGRWQIFV